MKKGEDMELINFLLEKASHGREPYYDLYTDSDRDLQYEDNEYLEDIMPTIFQIASQVKKIVDESMENIDKVDIKLEDKVLKIIIMTNEKMSFIELNKNGGLDKIVKILDLFDRKFNLSHELIVEN